ncbi:MAG: hypothetical protein H6590_09395 [Flavobacteriales bacterium]|nr:hypothetical protein [Flavobacteriales bacterium]
MKRVLHQMVLLSVALAGQAQQLVPFTMPDGRFVVWDQGRFEVLAEEAPRSVLPGPGPIVFLDHQEGLMAVEDELRKVRSLQRPPVDTVLRSGRLVAWRAGDSLKAYTGGRVHVLAQQAGRFTVGDSLVVFHDKADARLKVWWRGGLHVVADVGREAMDPQWVNGPNTLLFHDRSAGRLVLFHRGGLHLLCTDCPNARVAAGGDVVAYVDGQERFQVWDHQEVRELSGAPPRQFQAGSGLVGFTDLAGRLRVYRDGEVVALTDTLPSMFRVMDSALVFVERGAWRTEVGGSSQTLSEHIPEQWRVVGGTITWLDLDRGIRRSAHGDVVRLTRDGAYPWFEVHGQAVLFPGHRGERFIWQDGRTDVFY